MKYLFLIFCFLFVSCSKFKETDNSSSVFNTIMVEEIHKLIELKKNEKSYSQTICYIVLGNMYNETHGGEQCSIYASLSLGIDTIKLSGYAFVDDEFIACYIITDSCNNGIVNVKNLSKNREVIRKYYCLNQPITEGSYDYPANRYKIINKDSLVLINSIRY